MVFNEAEDTFFQVKKTLNCNGRLLDLSTPAVMGILNFTPDSFYDGGRLNNDQSIINTIESMISAGVDIIDIGGQSTKPGSTRISSADEWKRVSGPLQLIRKQFPGIIISIDTFYSEVAKNAIEEGVSIINDISAGEFDSNMHSLVASKKIPYVLMHMKGEPKTMQENPQYDNVTEEVLQFFIHKVHRLKEMGIVDVILDPGFGFGKNVNHNYELLRNLSLLKMIGHPILAGISRKSMITKVLQVKPQDALTGTVALNTIALLNGASILRVHDIKEANDVRKIVEQYLLVENRKS